MRKLTYLAVALVLAVVAAPALAAERYNLDPNHTQVAFPGTTSATPP
jgi:polyisoprenoid-binding protein YceI